MIKNIRFTFLCNEYERRLILELAKKLDRSQSDAVRWSIKRIAKKYNLDSESVEKNDNAQT